MLAAWLCAVTPLGGAFISLTIAAHIYLASFSLQEDYRALSARAYALSGGKAHRGRLPSRVAADSAGDDSYHSYQCVVAVLI